MPSVILGNVAPIEPTKVDPASDAVERVARPDLGNTTTVFDIPESLDLEDQAKLVRKVFESHHSDEPPAWVESPNDPLLGQMIAHGFGVEVGRPDDWVEGVVEDDVTSSKEQDDE